MARSFSECRSGVGDDADPTLEMRAPGTRSVAVCTTKRKSSTPPTGRSGVRHDTRLDVPVAGTSHVVGGPGALPLANDAPPGSTFADVMLTAGPGPRLVTRPAYSIGPPGVTTVGAVRSTDRSACSGTMNVATIAESFAPLGSEVPALTVVRFVNVGGPL
jgi:hypothetical protein